METRIGYVTHYYNHIGVAVISLSERLCVNDTLHITGHSSDFYQRACSREVDHHRVDIVEPGALVALQVAEQAHEGDLVFRVIPSTPEEKQEIQQEIQQEILSEQMKTR